MHITHITTDEKFIDSVHYLFEKAFPNSNKFLVIVAESEPQLKYIKDLKDVLVIKRTISIFRELRAMVKDADLIVLHGMNEIQAQLVNTSGNVEKFIYLVWGIEIYHNPLIYKEDILSKYTKELIKKISSRFDIIEKFKNIYRFIRYSDSINWKIFSSARYLNTKIAFKNIKAIGLLPEVELDYFISLKIVSEDIFYQKLTYYPLEFILKNLDTNIEIGNNVLVGNSATYTNNHLEIFEKLKDFKLDNRKVIVPLSYGDKKLTKAIKEYGESIFSHSFMAIEDFLPLKEYNKILQGAGIVIMNHYRQQAVGNILASMYLGAKIYLSEKNILLKYFRNLGCYVYSIENDLVVTNQNALEKLSQKQIEKNRRILENEIGENVLVSNLREGLKNYLAKNGILTN